jgi:hypothetical protein
MKVTWRRYQLAGLAVSGLCVALPLGVGRNVPYTARGSVAQLDVAQDLLDLADGEGAGTQDDRGLVGAVQDC